MNYNGYLILTDIDGTLTPRAGEVSAENAEAIEYFKKNGGLFTFATGRMPEYLSRFPFRANAPIVTINGTLICDGEENTLWQKPMAAKDCLTLSPKFPLKMVGSVEASYVYSPGSAANSTI